MRAYARTGSMPGLLQFAHMRADFILVVRALRHPAVPWPVRAVAFCAVGYVLSPIQIIPNFIPVVGLLDDVVVVRIAAALVRRITPDRVLVECDKARA
jgi:uncharacterized membrane protein YkvA (DUF1232 family)